VHVLFIHRDCPLNFLSAVFLAGSTLPCCTRCSAVGSHGCMDARATEEQTLRNYPRQLGDNYFRRIEAVDRASQVIRPANSVKMAVAPGTQPRPATKGKNYNCSSRDASLSRGFSFSAPSVTRASGRCGYRRGKLKPAERIAENARASTACASAAVARRDLPRIWKRENGSLPLILSRASWTSEDIRGFAIHEYRFPREERRRCRRVARNF